MPKSYSQEAKAISQAFARIENELLASMIRNLEKHNLDEAAEGVDWVAWQAEQLAMLEEYSRANGFRYGTEFDQLNSYIEGFIEEAYRTGRDEQEAIMLDAVRRGWEKPHTSVFGFPTERISTLLAATHADMMTAEYAVLRRADDIYRQVITDAQIYATSGAGTYAQAIDMATDSFLRKGVDGVVYSNGSRHSIREYSQMAVRTATKRAALVAEGDMRDEWGVHTVYVNNRYDACPDCMEWVGQVLVDDVYSGGTAEEAEELGYATLSEAMAQGLFHPNCRDTCSTYFEGISEVPAKPSQDEFEQAEKREELENALSNAEGYVREYSRLEEGSLERVKQERFGRLAESWQLTEYELAEALRDGRATANMEVVNSDAYRELFVKAASEQAADGLMAQAREILRHRSGSMYEDFALINSRTGSVLAAITDQATIQEVTVTDRVRKLMEEAKGRSLVIMHNHPLSMSISSADVKTLSAPSVRYGIVINHDGSITRYEVIDRNVYNMVMADGRIDELNQLMERMNDIYGTQAGDMLINEKLARDYGIRYERYTI